MGDIAASIYQGRYDYQPRIATLGASILSFDKYTTAPTTDLNFGGGGSMSWANRLSGQRVEFPTYIDPDTGLVSGLCFGVSGDNSAQIYARIPEVIATRPDLVFLEAGGNDDSGDSFATRNARDIAAENQLLNAGIEVVRMPITPRTAVGAGTTLRALHQQLAQAQRQRAKYTKGLRFCDWGEAMVDMASATGEPKPGATYDDRHPTTYGASLLGRALSNLLTSKFPASQRLIITPDDYYDATNNPRGNLFADPLFLTTGGNLGSNNTGVVATGWQVARTGSGGATAVWSQEARTDDIGDYGKKAAATITPDGSANANDFLLRRYIGGSITPTCPYPEGTWLRAECDIDLSGYDKILAVSLFFTVIGNVTRTVRSNQNQASTYFMPTGTLALRERTPFLCVPAGPVSIQAGIRIVLNNSGTGTPVIKIGSPVLRQVDDPRL